MKLNYLLIPIITISVSLLGSLITSGRMNWYKTIKLPEFTPPGYVIGIVWTIIFILAAISVLIFWNSFPKNSQFWLIFTMFLINIGLNVLWSYLFFGKELIGIAFWEAILLQISVDILIILIWPGSILAALLLAPYAAWVAFASYLNYSIWMLNK